MKINRSRKILLSSILLFVALYLVGFMYAAPLTCNAKSMWLMNFAGKVHNRVYFPLLRQAGEDSIVFRLWYANAKKWCQFEGGSNGQTEAAPPLPFGRPSPTNAEAKTTNSPP